MKSATPSTFLSLLLTLVSVGAWSVSYAHEQTYATDHHSKPKIQAPPPHRRAQPSLATVTCIDTFTRFAAYDNSQIALHINLLLDNRLAYDSLALPVYQPDDFNNLLHSLDLVHDNEWHVPWTDLQLNINYFSRRTPAQYFTPDNPNFSFTFDIAEAEKHHVDIYLKDRSRGGIGDTPMAQNGTPDPEEDGDPTLCDEDSRHSWNNIDASGGYGAVRLADSMWTTHLFPDTAWSASGSATNVRLNHEMTHLLQLEPGNSQGSGLEELMAMASEYLLGSRSGPVDTPALDDVFIDYPFNPGTIFDKGRTYPKWGLIARYLLQHFAADTTIIEDDLIYRWIRQSDLRRVLGSSDYANLGLGFTGQERLETILHDFFIAQWTNNPSPSFYGGRFGFTRGVEPHVNPGIFDPHNYCGRRTASMAARRYVVPLSLLNHDSVHVGAYCVTDSFPAFDCDSTAASTLLPPATYCDTTSVGCVSADYFQLEADSSIPSSSPRNLVFRVWWNPARTRMASFNVGRDYPHIACVTYPITSDSLYALGSTALAVIDGSTDPDRGFGQITIPGFGGAVKSAVVVFYMLSQPFVLPGGAGDTLGYAYSFRLEAPQQPSAGPISLVAYRPAGASLDSLLWDDGPGCSSDSHYVYRSIGRLNQFTPVASVAPGTSSIAIPPGVGDTVRAYRVLTLGGCTSNLASTGGSLVGADTLSGSMYLSGDLEVTPSGDLQVQAGSTIRIRPSFDSRSTGNTHQTEVTVYGKIRSLGTASDSIRWLPAVPSPDGSWYGIHLVRSSRTDSTSRFAYNSIQGAYHGLRAEHAAPVVEHSSVRHNHAYGIYLWDSNSRITDCILEQNHAAEIGIYGGSSPRVYGSFMHFSPKLSGGLIDDGIVSLGGGLSEIRKNRISGVGIGLFSVGASTNTPVLRGSAGVDASMYRFGLNDLIEFRYFGVLAMDLSLPQLGLQGFSDAGGNNIYSLLDTSVVFVANMTTGGNPVNAYQNYWGNGAAPPPTARFLGMVNGITFGSGYEFTFNDSAGPSFTYPQFNPAAELSSQAALFNRAIDMELDGDLSGAQAAIGQILASHPSGELLTGALSAAVRLSLRQDKPRDAMRYIAWAEAQQPSDTRTARRLEPQVLLADGRASEAIARYRELLQDPLYDHSTLLAEMAIEQALRLKAPAEARKSVTELLATCTNPHLLRHVRAVTEEYVGADTWTSSAKGEQIPLAAESATARPYLSQNYPNPMNPETIIQFGLPSNQVVYLRVFDIRGGLVRTLVEGTLSAGSHRIPWDGTNDRGAAVASGVYFYRMETEGTRFSKKLVVLR